MRTTLWLFLALTLSGQAEAQEIRDYLIRLPATPVLVPRTDASHRFEKLLYGPMVRELGELTIPFGVTNVKENRLIALGAKFAPMLHRTNFSVPRDFEEILTLEATDTLGGFVIRCDSIIPLHRDQWDVSGAGPVKVDSGGVSLGRLPSIQCPIKDGASIYTHRARKQLPDRLSSTKPARRIPPTDTAKVYTPPGDRDLQNLLDGIGPPPERVKSRPSVRADKALTLYFDFPGHDARTWLDIYDELSADSLLSKRTYLHPLVFEHPTANGVNKYEFVLQYWFFYPFNDGANDHEGDWEHINVSLGTKARLNQEGEARLLDSADLAHILDVSGSDDDLVISAVDYYFHHFVVTIDYKSIYENLDTTSPREPPISRWLTDSAVVLRHGKSERSCTPTFDPAIVDRRWGNDLRRSTEPYYSRVIQERFGYRIDSIVARRPCGDTLVIRFARRSETRFVGWLRDWVGDRDLATHPVGYIAGNNKSLFQLLEARSGNNNNSHGTYPFPGIWRGIAAASSEKVGGAKPTRKRHAAGKFVEFHKDEIRLLPDWERCTVDLISPEGRRNWAWFVLPIKWGYPATQSPGAELLKNFDFGQVAPDGPAFNLGWNSVGGGPGFERFDPSPVTLLLTNSPIDYMDNRAGRWNIPGLAVSAIPPISAVTSITGVLFTRYAKHEPAFSFYERGKEPARRASFGVALSPTDNAFASLLPPVDSLRQAGLDPAGLKRGLSRHDQDATLRGSYTLHLGKYVSTESSVSLGTGSLHYRVRTPSGGDVGEVSGRLKVLTLLGDLRVDAVRPWPGTGLYLRGGGGWTWYRLREDATFTPTGGSVLTPIESPPPNRFPLGVLPNSVALGTGVEIKLPGTPSTPDVVRYRTQYGIRLGANYYHTKGAGGWWDFDIAGVVGSNFGIAVFPVGMLEAALVYLR